MIFITTYKSTIAHYAATDGSHGVVISEADDLEPGYANCRPSGATRRYLCRPPPPRSSGVSR